MDNETDNDFKLADRLLAILDKMDRSNLTVDRSFMDEFLYVFDSLSLEARYKIISTIPGGLEYIKKRSH